MSADVTFSVTTCRRLELFRRTMDGFLEHCRDPERIGRWLCVDDGSSSADLAEMERAYPWLEIVTKPESERGHPGSIRALWSSCDTPLVLHFEDDWEVAEGFGVQQLIEELGDADQLQLLWDRRRLDQEFNPRHPLMPDDVARILDGHGLATEPKEEGGWWWPGFSLNPSLFRMDRCRELAPLVPDGERFELELALRLRRGGFRLRQRMFAMRHVGRTSAYVLSGSPRVHEVESVLGELAAICAGEPRRAIELFGRLDPENLDPEQSLRAFHALAAARWYVDREAGRRTLAEMWRRLHGHGRLWSIELAELLGFYRESWESVVSCESSVSRERLVSAADSALAEAGADPPLASCAVAAASSASPRCPPPVDPDGSVTVALTTCRRLELFVRTLRSFLDCCTDLHLVARWLCVDDNSSEADRDEMRRLFPWLELHGRDDPDRGHGGSLQLLTREVRTPYVFLLEDDHELFVRSDYLTRCLRGLSVSPWVGQCLLNRNYAETEEDASLEGGMRFRHRGESFVAHLHDPERRVVRGRSNAHWPHFSLRPGLHRMSAWRLGFRNEPGFEPELAVRYMEAGYTTIFLDGVHHRHIGKLTRETGANAYTLNDTRQF